MHLLRMILKASGKKGVPQGGVISPLLSNLYLTEVDRMLERAKETTRQGRYTYVEYVRWADDIVILIDAYPRHDWLLRAVEKRLRGNSPSFASRSMRRRAGSWTWRRERASDSWASSSAASAVFGAFGGRSVRPS